MLDTCICLVGGREHLLGMCCVSNWLICVVCTYIQWTCIIRFSFPPFTIVDDSWRDNGGKRVQCISMQIVSVCVCVCVCVHARILGVSSVHGIVINTLFINGTVTTGNIVPWR